ncbi:hypothetical protein BYT27DRAFT_7342813 [Phlegmacium glaucopus]|nr:hypothetical protein BYT27DRAFT_7342813 [Phlegmacium glaucopus]
MLNPPLSLLSDDLFGYIVDHLAKLPFSNRYLYNLSLADRAFTRFCQAYIFKDLHLGYGSGIRNVISCKLETMNKILNDEPSFANRVRMVKLTISDKLNVWLFNDLTFISIVQLLANSFTPPHKLHLSGIEQSFIIQDPILVVEWLTQSFFSQTLTVLHLTQCKDVPLTLFLICPKLREILLDEVTVIKNYDKYPDKQCSGRELPALEYLDYRNSEGLVNQMITPPPGFNTAVVIWSKLRVLKLCPQEKEELACLQPILDIACNTLEELYLTNQRVDVEQLSLSGLVDLRDLSYLHVFALYAIIKCDVPESAVVRDINLVLSTIPTSNKIRNLSFDFTICGGEYPFGECLKEDWVGLCNEVVRISAGKPLNLNLKTSVRSPILKIIYPLPGKDELYKRITERILSLSDHPNICTRFRHPARSET